MATLQARFEKSADDVKKLKSKPDPYTEMSKASTEGFENTPKPGLMQLWEKGKYNAWKEVVEAGTTKDQAMEQYIELVDKLKEKYGWDENGEGVQVKK
ncbi:MAG: hypothetical protein M1834_006711 [Cirrosporium novae-zelandiae]|nr:MAG: hypothetical protein M1834_006711 [Cirrosporium novae-zelandiae]